MLEPKTVLQILYSKQQDPKLHRYRDYSTTLFKQMLRRKIAVNAPNWLPLCWGSGVYGGGSLIYKRSECSHLCNENTCEEIMALLPGKSVPVVCERFVFTSVLVPPFDLVGSRVAFSEDEEGTSLTVGHLTEQRRNMGGKNQHAATCFKKAFLERIT